MLKDFWKVMLFALLFISALAAQEKGGYLVSIQFNPQADLDQFEKLQLPIYHRFNEILISGCTHHQLQVLDRLHLRYQILEAVSETESYYLVQSKSAQEINLESVRGEIIFNHVDGKIIRSSQIDPAEFAARGYQVAPLKRTPWFFQNHKVVSTPAKTISIDVGTVELLNEINADSVRYFIQSLQDFGTRFLFAPTRDSVAEWIKNQFLRMGITDVQIDSFVYSSTWQKNVVATIPGSINPGQVYIVGGHHDSYTYNNPMVYAPGADDNASGTAAALEIARAMMAIGYHPEATIKFVTFAAEEYGLWGSEDFAQKAYASGMDIALMINHDMISYSTDTPGNWEVGMNYYTGHEYLLDLTSDLIERYTTLTPRTGTLNASFSDSYSFWTMGFPAFYFEEWDFSPFYHSDNDVIGNYNMDFCAEVIRASGALLLFTSATPAVVQGLQLMDRGDGSSLEASWLPNGEPDMGHYNVYVGLASGVYDTSYSAAQSPFVIDNLTEGLLYHVGISAVDTAGNESFVVEKTAIPYSIPFPPQQLQDLPGWHQITFNWRAGHEMDLLGYNLYRADIPAGQQILMNSQVIQDTFYVDQTAQIGQYYYYTVRAIDSLLNESPNSAEIRSRVISLDQGILLVDETIDGNGALLNPTDQQVDSFYTAILEGFPITMYDLQQSSEIKLADLGAFSTVLWQGNDFTNFTLTQQVRESIGRYLEAGGKMLISEIHPSKAFASTTSYPRNFASGEFIYDYLKVGRVEFYTPARFLGALPLVSGYDSLFVDPSKSTLSLNYHILKVESIIAAPGAQNIYQYDSWYASNTSQGIMKGKPVGIEYLGTDYQLVLLSFPLYYMNFTEAQQLVHLVLIEKFGELTSLSTNISEVPERFELFQNYPNPFNPMTTISFNLPFPGQVTIKIYNTLGEEVASLLSASLLSGFHSYEWDASDLASGIYLCHFTAHHAGQNNSDLVQTRKLMLLK